MKIVSGLFTSCRLLGQVDLYGVTEISNRLIVPIGRAGCELCLVEDELCSTTADGRLNCLMMMVERKNGEEL